MITAAKKSKLGQVPIRMIPFGEITPSAENEQLYRPIDPADPEVRALAESIREHGIQEPLIVTRDFWIISGHRRYAAAELAGLETLPCRIKPIFKHRNHDEFLQLLRECNWQRIKSFDEKLREEIVSADPEEAYESLIEHRAEASEVVVETIELRGQKQRATISKAKEPFLRAVKKVIKSRRKFWPLSDRQIHYALLNDPPLIHASKPKSTYTNTPQSYKALVDLLTRARLESLVTFSAIADATRPVHVWNVHRDVQGFLCKEIKGLFKGYWRDLMQSQPNHIEIVGEKNTIDSIIKPAAMEYCIPMTIGRGFCSLPPRYEMAERYRESGKERLVLLILSDFDPDGEEIAHSFARSLRDDFDIQDIEPIKVALTADQVAESGLPPILKAKQKSTNYDRFIEENDSDDVFELEAIPPKTLQQVLRDAIDEVIDVDAFNHELDQEKQDAAQLENVRRRVHHALADLDLGEDQP